MASPSQSLRVQTREEAPVVVVLVGDLKPRQRTDWKDGPGTERLSVAIPSLVAHLASQNSVAFAIGDEVRTAIKPSTDSALVNIGPLGWL